MIRTLPLVVISLLFCGCCCNSSNDGRWVTDSIQCRTGYDVEWQKCCALQHDANQKVAFLLEGKLSVDDVVQISLLNNPSIQTQFESIGVSRAQYLAAMTPRNPFVYWEVRRQTNPYSPNLDIQWSVTAFLWDLLLVPMKTRAAGIALQQQQLQVAQSVLDHILTTKTAFYQLQASEAHFLTQKLHLSEAGDLATSEDLSEQARYQTSLVSYYMAELEVKKLKEDLNQLMGLESCPDRWEIDLTLSPYTEESLSMCDVVKLALFNRLELQNTRWGMWGVLNQQKLQDWWTFLDPQIGPTQEINPDATIETGFVLTHALPIFNHGQAARKQLYFELRQLWHQYQATRIQIVSTARLAFERVEKFRELLVLFEHDILPLVDAGHADEKLDRDGMERLDNLEQQYVELLRDYWIHRSELEHAVGGSLVLHNFDLKRS